MRADDEVLLFQDVPSAPMGIHVLNPAFDVTPHELVTAIITEERCVNTKLSRVYCSLTIRC